MRTRVPLSLPLLAAACATPGRDVHVGPEVQVYPAGVQFAAFSMWEVNSTDAVTARVGWNETDRRDFGDHDDETGGGPGFSGGWRRYFGEDHSGWMLGARTDVWFLDIDWVDRPGGAGERRGNTDVVVLQPTVLGGYRWNLGVSGWALELTAAGGTEINVSTSGEDVGEGAIGLLGFHLTRSF